MLSILYLFIFCVIYVFWKAILSIPYNLWTADAEVADEFSVDCWIASSCDVHFDDVLNSKRLCKYKPDNNNNGFGSKTMNTDEFMW